MAVLYVPAAKGQAEGPVITGSAGFLYSNNDGQTSVQPILTPVVLVPLGSHLLVETSAQLQGYIARSSANGPYEGQFFGTLQYLQLDWVVNSHLTVVAGRFTTPFNIYGERLGPMWLHNLQDAPLIYPIGTRTTGSSNGGMVRGVVVSRPTWLLNYTVFFSTLSEVSNLESGRAFGARTGIFLPRARLEVGTSYQRFLQDQHNDSYGAYFSWQPRSAPVDAKGEYAHSPQGHGYWIEAALRFKDSGKGGLALAKFQPVVRGQQFFRKAPGVNDFLPATDTQRVDFGLNYYPIPSVRLNASYGRQFTDARDINYWTADITYHFLFPMAFWLKESK